MPNGSIYLVTHKVSGKKYVGQHDQEDPSIRRWRDHVNSANRGDTPCIFHKALRKYGKDAFAWEVLMVCPHEALNNMEAYWAEQFSSYYTDVNEKGLVAGGYNMIWCGEGLKWTGMKHTPETITKLRESHIGVNAGDNHYLRRNPERAPRGDNHYLHCHPEKAARGDKNGARIYPERLARGERNGAYTHPEKLRRGEDNTSAKLNPDKVRLIRIMYSSGHKITMEKLGAMFGINASTVERIINRKKWVHIQ